MLVTVAPRPVRHGTVSAVAGSFSTPALGYVVVRVAAAGVNPVETHVRSGAYAQAGLAEGILRPIVAQELPLAAAPRAHAEIMREPHRGKTVPVA